MQVKNINVTGPTNLFCPFWDMLKSSKISRFLTKIVQFLNQASGPHAIRLVHVAHFAYEHKFDGPGQGTCKSATLKSWGAMSLRAHNWQNWKIAKFEFKVTVHGLWQNASSCDSLNCFGVVGTVPHETQFANKIIVKLTVNELVVNIPDFKYNKHCRDKFIIFLNEL